MSAEPKSKLAENLIRLRKNMGLTQEQVASALGIKRSTYAYYEKTTTPPIKTIEQLSRLFGTTAQDVMFGASPTRELDSFGFFSDGPESNPLTTRNYDTPSFNQLTPFEQKFYLKMRLLPDPLKNQLFATLNELWEKSDLE